MSQECHFCFLACMLQSFTNEYARSMSGRLVGVPGVYACLEIGATVLHGLDDQSVKVDLKRDLPLSQLQAWADQAKKLIEQSLNPTGKEPNSAQALLCRVSFRTSRETRHVRPGPVVAGISLLAAVEKALREDPALAFRR